MLNLNSTIDLNFTSFWHWWKRELSFLVPEKIKTIFSNQDGFIIVRVEGQHIRLSYQKQSKVETLAYIARDDTARDHYQDLLAKDARLSKAKLVIRLTGTDAIQKELLLPAAANENLHQVIAYELDRYTPFKAEQVYFAVQRLPFNDANRIKVLLVLTTRATLNTFYADINAMVATPVLADYENVSNDIEVSHTAYNLLPDTLIPKVAMLPRLVHSSLIALVFLLLSAVIVLPVWFEYQAVQELNEKIAKVEKEAKKIKASQLEIATLIEESQQLLNEKNATPSMLTMLNSLSNLMKDDTWLAYLQYTDGHFQLQGESAAASKLIAILEDSSVFSHAAFVSPVTQDAVSKQERFQITVDPIKKVVTNEQQ